MIFPLLFYNKIQLICYCILIMISYQFKLQMSSKFSNTGTGFSTSSVFKQEQYIKQIVQNEVLGIFEDIKIEIEAKIKSIDKNIYDLRNQVKKIYQQCKIAQLSQVFYKIQKVEAELQILKYNNQLNLKTSRTKSLEKQRKPIFKKDGEKYDFSSVILGLQSQKSLQLQPKTSEKKQYTKPPLPRQNAKIFKNEYATPNSIPHQSSIVKRSPILQDSGTIHKWLHENNNRESSCFSGIIKQQQIQESLFF